MFVLLLVAPALGTVNCPNGGVCDPNHCLGGIAECCSDGSVCPGHTCDKCQCQKCGDTGHDSKDYDAASALTRCPGSASAFCQPDLCIGGTAMCCPSGAVCPGSTCATCECPDCSMTSSDGMTTSIAHPGGVGGPKYDDSSRLSTCANSAATCDPDNCANGIAECCADGTVCPGHVCEQCQCPDCTVRPRTHALAPKPVASAAAPARATGGGSGPWGSPMDPCNGCAFCDRAECARCGACDAGKIGARFGGGGGKATGVTAGVTATAASIPADASLPLLATERDGHGLGAPAAAGRRIGTRVAVAALALGAGGLALVALVSFGPRAAAVLVHTRRVRAAVSRAGGGVEGGAEGGLERSLIGADAQFEEGGGTGGGERAQ